MSPISKIVALCAFAATLVAAAPMPNADSTRVAQKLDITTVNGKDFALVPVMPGKDVSVHFPELETRKREEASNDAVAYNPAYLYAYKGGYGYIN